MCVKCKHRVFFDPNTKVLYYMDDGCNKVPVPADAVVGGVPIGSGGAPSLPPIDPDAPINADNSCYKANAIADTFVAFIDAVFDAWEGAGILFTSATSKFQRLYPDYRVSNWNMNSFWLDHFTEDREDLNTLWDGMKEDLHETFLCQMSFQMGKEVTLSDLDLAIVKGHSFYAGDGGIGDFITGAKNLIPDAYWQEQAAYYTTGEIGTCDCVGDAPTPPPPDVPEGFTKILWIGAPSEFAPTSPEFAPTPQALFDAAFAGAVQTGAQSWESKVSQNGSNHALSLMFYFSHPGARITNYKYTLDWEGGTSSMTIHVNISRSALISENWTQLFERDNLPASDIASPVNDEIPGIAAGHYLWINYHILGDPAGKKLVLSNVRFDIAADDGTWTRTNVLPGQLIQL